MRVSEVFHGPDQKFKAPEQKNVREKADELVKDFQDKMEDLTANFSGEDFQKEFALASTAYSVKIQELLKNDPSLLQEYQQKVDDYVNSRVKDIIDQDKDNDTSSSSTHV